MSDVQKAVAKMKKASDLTNLAFHANGPKSFKNGVGALVVALYRAEGTMTQRELVEVLGMGRKGVKEIVKKAVRSELVEMGESDKKKTYTVTLTEVGQAVAEKRMEADKAVAEKVFEGISAEELEQLQATCDKIIVNLKEMGVKGRKKGAFKHSHRHCKGERKGRKGGRR